MAHAPLLTPIQRLLDHPRIDMNEVVISFDTDDTTKARDFAASPDLKETMAKAGVSDNPSFYFLQSTQSLSAMRDGWIELLGLRNK
jgi:hypothetical protein